MGGDEPAYKAFSFPPAVENIISIQMSRAVARIMGRGEVRN